MQYVLFCFMKEKLAWYVWWEFVEWNIAWYIWWEFVEWNKFTNNDWYIEHNDVVKCMS